MTINRNRLPPELSANCIFGSGTGACGEWQLNHSDGEAERCYRELKQRGVSVRVGMEATGDSCWFERLLAELGFELWIGDPTEIKAERVRKQKTDREDARLLLKLLLENRFPRIWVPSPENRDLQQRLWHRPRLVQMRTRITPGSFRARTPVPANNGWDTLASRAIHCCASCWEKQRKQPHEATRAGDVVMCT